MRRKRIGGIGIRIDEGTRSRTSGRRAAQPARSMVWGQSARSSRPAVHPALKLRHWWSPQATGPRRRYRPASRKALLRHDRRVVGRNPARAARPAATSATPRGRACSSSPHCCPPRPSRRCHRRGGPRPGGSKAHTAIEISTDRCLAVEDADGRRIVGALVNRIDLRICDASGSDRPNSRAAAASPFAIQAAALRTPAAAPARTMPGTWPSASRQLLAAIHRLLPPAMCQSIRSGLQSRR